LNTIVLRKVTSKDIQTLREISIRTYTDQFEKQNNPLDFQLYIEEAFSNEALLEEVNNKESVFYFVLLKATLVAYIKLNTGTAQTDIKETTGIELQRIYVDKNFQNQGIGRQLIKMIVDKANREGYAYLWLGVWEHNPNAIRFYKQLDFTVFDKHYFMMGTDKQTDILMKLIF